MQALSIHNYKSLVNFELRNINSFTVFVGANGVGKTNVFEALEYLNFKYFNRWKEVDELFGGKQQIFNRNLHQDTLRIDMLNGENFFYNFVASYDNIEGDGFNPLFELEGLLYKKQFLENFLEKQPFNISSMITTKTNPMGSVCFDGDSIEFITKYFENRTIEESCNELITTKKLFKPMP